MTARISDEFAARVVAAIDALPVLAVVRESIRWEVIPVLVPDRSGAAGDATLQYVVGIALPVPGTDDFVLRIAPVEDDQLIQRTVTFLYEEAFKGVDEARAARNGRRSSPGGLVLP